MDHVLAAMGTGEFELGHKLAPVSGKKMPRSPLRRKPRDGPAEPLPRTAF